MKEIDLKENADFIAYIDGISKVTESKEKKVINNIVEGLKVIQKSDDSILSVNEIVFTNFANAIKFSKIGHPGILENTNIIFDPIMEYEKAILQNIITNNDLTLPEDFVVLSKREVKALDEEAKNAYNLKLKEYNKTKSLRELSANLIVDLMKNSCDKFSRLPAEVLFTEDFELTELGLAMNNIFNKFVKNAGEEFGNSLFPEDIFKDKDAIVNGFIDNYVFSIEKFDKCKDLIKAVNLTVEEEDKKKGFYLTSESEIVASMELREKIGNMQTDKICSILNFLAPKEDSDKLKFLTFEEYKETSYSKLLNFNNEEEYKAFIKLNGFGREIGNVLDLGQEEKVIVEDKRLKKVFVNNYNENKDGKYIDNIKYKGKIKIKDILKYVGLGIGVFALVLFAATSCEEPNPPKPPDVEDKNLPNQAEDLENKFNEIVGSELIENDNPNQPEDNQQQVNPEVNDQFVLEENKDGDNEEIVDFDNDMYNKESNNANLNNAAQNNQQPNNGSQKNPIIDENDADVLE